MALIYHFIRLYLVPLPPYVKVNVEEVVFEDTIESGKVPESAFGLLKTYWNLAWFGGIHVLLQWKVPKGDPNFSPKLFLDNSELTIIKNSFSQAILEQLSVNLNKSKVEITTCFNEFFPNMNLRTFSTKCSEIFVLIFVWLMSFGQSIECRMSNIYYCYLF